MSGLLTITMALAGLLVLLNGCGGKPYTCQGEVESPDRPGILSGEDGVFAIYSSQNDAMNRLMKNHCKVAVR